MNVGIIVCTNGYGHIRRQSILARYLISQGNEVSIYFPRDLLKFVSPDLVVHCRDFDTNTSSCDWLSGMAQNWTKNIGALDQYDIVISDNSLDVLSIRPDAIISGSFFWHRALDLSKSLFKEQEALLSKYEPVIVSNRYFSPPYISSEKNFKPIGFIHDNRALKSPNKTFRGKTALLTVGMGHSESEGLLKLYIKDVLARKNSKFKKFGKIYVESRMFTESLPTPFFRAMFDEEMFSELDVVIGRPGLGIVSECVCRNIDYISIREKSNSEMVFNNEVLETEFKVHVASNFEDGLEKASSPFSEKSLFKIASCDGVNDFSSIIINEQRKYS